MFVSLLGLMSQECRDAPNASSKRHVVDGKGSARADDLPGHGGFAPRRSVEIRRRCNSLLRAADPCWRSWRVLFGEK